MLDSHLPTMSTKAQFEATNQTGYMLSRNCNAASRLNLQYFLWKDTLGFDLHPTISSAIGDRNIAIADVGTGTAIWPINVASEYPLATLKAFDIDCTQAPPTIWLPKNLEINALNVLEPVPVELEGAFDVIHVRLLVLVVQNSDPRPIIAVLRQMLKPGGWLQWDEVEQRGQFVEYANKLPSDRTDESPGIEKLLDLIYAGGKHDWISRLSHLLANEGFENAKTDTYLDRPAMLQANSDQHMMTMNEFAEKLTELGSHEQSLSVSNLVREAICEMRAKNAVYAMPKLVCIARKPAMRS